MISGSLIRKTLSTPVVLDNYLLDVSRRVSTHEFLGGATQGCYIRMIQLLGAIFMLQGRDLSTVRVLDWGAGKGHISYLLKAAGFDVVSCDIASSDNDSSFGQDAPILTEKSISVVPLRDPWVLPFEDGKFDLVVSFGVLEHVQNDFESLRELRRIIKPSGLFFFSFLPFWLSWSQRLAQLRGNWYHPRLYKSETVAQMAEKAGFIVGGIWHGQFLPKNSFPHSNIIEGVDRILTWYTPLKYFATNIEGILVAK